ncbi:RecBCD enzyme subunit RecD [Betaproteobacteria bacterium]|nr:RecBCD enzyme subunit RecD [Betaproteobacteria bacterium]GHU31041.1 RecBCD enzyme subunit RecD [Betaproteobacteria bacterium]
MNPTTLLNDRESLLDLLREWAVRGWLRELDVALARFFAGLDPDATPLLLLGAALTSHQLGRGHVCLDLAATLKNPDAVLSLPPEGETASATVQLPGELLCGLSLEAWQDALAASPLLSAENAPLVIEGARLYLRRYWQYERTVSDRLAAFQQAAVNVPPDLESRLKQLFAFDNPEQKQACAIAAQHRFAIITGGPGTGKTTTVVRLLALLQTAAVAAGQPLAIRLAAPTGKAAARLTESIRAQVNALPVADEVRATIPREVATVHRLLGSLPETRHFRHDKQNPLQLDVLVIDEASMVSLEMMANLLDALSATARLILLGDKDQLASVEAGAVLGDLCNAKDAGHIAVLEHSHRFGSDSDIGKLARAVNAGDATTARELFRKQKTEDRGQISAVDNPALNELLREGYVPYLQALKARSTFTDDEEWASNVLAAFDQFRLLCTVREGPWGVEEQNRRIVQTLFPNEKRDWYAGRPVMVTRNDYSLNLMNGDIGIALELPAPEPGGVPGLRVVFPRNVGNPGLRYLHPSRLSEVETAFAMTVHKSQGSEFAHTALLLPDARNPVLTRELLYTAITRAKTRFSLIESGDGVFEDALVRRVERYSGLAG